MKVNFVSDVTTSIVKINYRYTGLSRMKLMTQFYIIEIPELKPSFEVSHCETFTLWEKCRNNIACLRAKRDFLEDRKRLSPITIVSIELVNK